MNIIWNWKRSIFGKVDQAFRVYFLQEDIGQVQTIFLTVSIWSLLFIYVDYLKLGSSNAFIQILVLRLAISGISIGIPFYLRKRNNITLVDSYILIWTFILVFLVVFAPLKRGGNLVETMITHYLTILGIYLVLPNRLLFKLLPSITITVIDIIILTSYQTSNTPVFLDPAKLTNIATLLVINIVGVLSSLRIERQRYHQYLIQKTLIAGREQLEELVKTDSLTGVLNRRGFFEMAELEFSRFKRYKKPFTFVMIDLDNLKHINDTYGHPTGDLSLQRLVCMINQEKRSTDLFGRLAGDEFGLLLLNTNTEETTEILLRSKKALEKNPVEVSDTQFLKIRFSAGVTEAKETDNSFDDIYNRADTRLLDAKSNGRDAIKHHG